MQTLKIKSYMKTDEERRQEVTDLLDKIRKTLKKKASPETSEDRTIRLSDDVLVISSDEIEPLILEMIESLKRKRVLNSSGFFNQSRKVCADYFADILPLIIDEYKGNMDTFIERFCFSPDNHGDRTCLAVALQKNEILNEFFQPVSEEGWEILRSFHELTERSPYEKGTPESTIEYFMMGLENLNSEKTDVSSFYDSDEY